MTKSLYGLIIGIDDYPIPSHRLKGCVNDAMAWKEYLEARTEKDQIDLRLEMLLNGDATRMNIIRKFEDHLIQAGPDDIIFVYFSGHGSQEDAHETFWEMEPDKTNETLVCWDSRIEDGMDLADKELSTLIAMATERTPHTLIILDCCHSGTGTRSLDDTVARQAPESASRFRPFDSYVLPTKDTTERGSLSEDQSEVLIVPEGKHINLSAALSSQTAKETNIDGVRRGVFTYSMLHVLKSSTAELTYTDLIRRVRTMVSNRVGDQTPQIYATETEELNTTFLGGVLKPQPVYFILNHDRDLGWVIDAGEIHGMISGASLGDTTGLAIFDWNSTIDDMADLGNAKGSAYITNTLPQQSQINTDLELDELASYKVLVTSLPIEKMQIYFDGDWGGVEEATRAIKLTNEAGGPSPYIARAQNTWDAHYVLQAKNGSFCIARPDNLDQLLVERVEGLGPASAQDAISKLEHIARWKQTLELSNPGSRLAQDAVRIEVYQLLTDGSQKPLGLVGEPISLSYNHSGGKEEHPRIKVKLVNTSYQRLYCSLMILTSQFQVEPGLFAEGGIWLDPGREAWAINGKAFTATVSQGMADLGRYRLEEVLKLVVSTSEFNANLMRQPKLGLPRSANRNIGAQSMSALDRLMGRVQHRDLSFDAGEGGSFDDWVTSEAIIGIERMA